MSCEMGAGATIFVDELGPQPRRARISLREGFSWGHDVRLRVGTWPVGTTAAVEFSNGQTWAATSVSGNVLSWRVSETMTTAESIPDGTGFTVSVTLPDGKYPLYEGFVQRIEIG